MFHLHGLYITYLGRGASIGRARADNPGEMLFCNKGVLEDRLVGHETMIIDLSVGDIKLKMIMLGERNSYTAYLC